MEAGRDHAAGHLPVRKDRHLTEDGKVTGRFRATGIRPKFYDRLKACGISTADRRCSKRWWRSAKMPHAGVIVAFIVVFALILMAVSVGLKFLDARRKKQVASMLQTASGERGGTVSEPAEGGRP